mgnify:CR=1 FL=1
MDFAREIARFVTAAIGGIYIVNEQTREIAFADAAVERLYGSGLVGKRYIPVEAMDRLTVTGEVDVALAACGPHRAGLGIP